MNSSEPLVTKRTGLLEQARASFDWIDLLVVPTAICVMETQPIVLALTLVVVAFLGSSAVLPLGAGSITLLLLGLHWWAKAVSALTQVSFNTTRARLLQLLGLFLAVGLAVVTHLSLLNNTPALFFSIILIVGFWYAGMVRVQTGPNDEYVLTSFKIGLGVLLGVLILTLIIFDPVPPALHDGLTYALPTFFLSGLIGLSFTRINMIRKESASSAQRESQGDPTRGWLLILTLTWAIVIVSTLAFEVLGFQPVVVAASFLWSGLGIVANFILLLLSPLFQLFSKFFFPTIPPSQGIPFPQTTSSNGQPPPLPYFAVIFLIGRLVLLAILLVILFFVIRAILRRWRMAPDDESEEEIRESLSRESILKTRRKEQRQRQKRGDFAALEPLDPNSIRARYRELLQELAWNGEKLARRADETPSEYEKRLLALLKKEPSTEAQEDGMPTDPAMLDELTSAYVQERYGGKHPRLLHGAYVPAWIPRFVRLLTVSIGGRDGASTNTTR
jgi:Domain of unknown function (DUF4129)